MSKNDFSVNSIFLKRIEAVSHHGMEKCKETINHDAMYSHEANIMQQLPPASKELAEEIQLIRDGLLK